LSALHLAGSRRVLSYSIPDFHFSMMLPNLSGGKALGFPRPRLPERVTCCLAGDVGVTTGVPQIAADLL
jgi:hypothetical protein